MPDFDRDCKREDLDDRPRLRFSLGGLLKAVFYCCVVLGVFSFLRAASRIEGHADQRRWRLNETMR